jgi:hypothetical protein
MPQDNVSLKEYIDELFALKDEAVKAALAAAKEAVDKAEINAEKWRDNANEWRGAMSDREGAFLSRKEFYSIILTAVAVITLVLTMIKAKL